MSRLDDLLEELELAEEALEDVYVVEVAKSRIPYAWIDYPNARVGLDVSGNVVRVEFSDRAEVIR